MDAPLKPTFFPTASHFRKWLARHSSARTELWVGFHKKRTGRPSLTWPESVDEALCVGWIDGIRKRIDDVSYAIRFTRRKLGSTWSSVNIRRAKSLSKEGRMRPAGVRAFAARRENRSGIYSYEQRSCELPEPHASGLRENGAAWQFFRSQPPSYRKAASWWVVSAKREETRSRRLASLADFSTRGLRIPRFVSDRRPG